MAQSSEIVDKLAKAPTRVKVALLAAVLGVLGGLYYYLFYSDLSAEEESLRASKARAVEEQRNLRKRLTRYQELLRQKHELEESLKKNAVKLPASSELPAFFQHLQIQAGTANTQLVNWTRDKELPIDTYVKVPVKMEVRGDFYQLIHYFKLLFETPRIITVEGLFIGDAKKEGDRRVLTARFTASTFRQSDRPPQPAGAPTSGATPAPGGTKPGTAPAPGTPAPGGKPGTAPAPAPAKPGAPAPAPAKPGAPAPAPTTPPTGTK
jgi:type IV pilus assembly protein PilO